VEKPIGITARKSDTGQPINYGSGIEMITFCNSLRRQSSQPFLGKRGVVDFLELSSWLAREGPLKFYPVPLLF
jgi:hypothetical protein